MHPALLFAPHVNNSPINYVDPSGHLPCLDDGYCGNPSDDAYQIHIYSNAIKEIYRWNLKGKWKLEELKTIYETGKDIEKFADNLTDGNGLEWMQKAFGGTTIMHSQHRSGRSYAWPFIGVQLDKNWMTHSWGAKVLLAHELGHIWDINTGFAASYHMNLDLGGSGVCLFCAPGNNVPQWDPGYHRTPSGDAYGNSGRNEYFAEAFSATIYNRVSVPNHVVAWIDSQIANSRYFLPWR